MMKRLVLGALALVVSACTSKGTAEELKVGETAPEFTAKTDAGTDFDLASRKGKWTVLYFYPKAETPGCTKQACAYRDNIKKVAEQGAEIFGISADTVAAQAGFKKNHQLNFTLLADPDEVVIKQYGAKMPLMSMSKRWTFILDPDLKIRSIDRDVDPAIDALNTAAKIAEMKKSKS